MENGALMSKVASCGGSKETLAISNPNEFRLFSGGDWCIEFMSLASKGLLLCTFGSVISNYLLNKWPYYYYCY